MKERAEAKKGLRSMARASAQSREQVIRELVKLIKGSEPLLGASSTAHYDAWSFAAELLGQVKAAEALDVLIACIDCNDGIHGLFGLPLFGIQGAHHDWTRGRSQADRSFE